MAEFKNLNDVTNSVDSLTGKAEKQAMQRKSLFEDLMKEINNINPQLGGFEELSVLLNLDEDKFAIVGPVFLSELEKSYNNVNDKVSFAQAINAAGLKVEDIREQYVNIADKIDSITLLSRQKRDFIKQLLGMTYNAVADTEGIAKKIISIPIEYCSENAKMPTYAHLTDAGMDVYALEDITIAPGETKLIPIGVKVAIPVGYELQVRPKSGISLKSKLRVANAPGTIDAGYRDEIAVIIDNIDQPIKNITFNADNTVNMSNIVYGQSYTIGKGEKIAQLVLNEVPKAFFYEVESVASIENDGRKGGFGSTGNK